MPEREPREPRSATTYLLFAGLCFVIFVIAFWIGSVTTN